MLPLDSLRQQIIRARLTHDITHFSNGDCDDLKDVLGVDFDCGGVRRALFFFRAVHSIDDTAVLRIGQAASIPKKFKDF